MIKKLSRRVCIFGYLVLLCFVAGVSARAETVLLKFGHASGPDTPLGFGADKLAALAEDYSGGRLRIKVFHSGQLGEGRALLQGLRYGLLDMTMTRTDFLADMLPELRVFELPFIFRDAEHAYESLDTIGMEVIGQAKAWGLKALAMMERAQLQMCNNRTMIRDPRDIRGLYMRLHDAGFSRQMLFYMGARPVKVADADMERAIANGRIDGLEYTLEDIWRQKPHAVCRYISLTSHIYKAEPIFISMAAWSRLDQQQQDALVKAARDATDWQRALCRKANTDYLLKMYDAGLTAIFAVKDRRGFEQAVLPVWNLFASELENGQYIINRVRAIP